MPGRRHDAPDSADTLVSPGDLADREDEPGGRRGGITTIAHRRRTRMGGLPGEPNAMPLDPRRSDDCSQREAEPLEHRPLLDMELHVGQRAGEALRRPGARSTSTP